MSGSCESKPGVAFAAIEENPNDNPTPDVREDAHAFLAGGGRDEILRGTESRCRRVYPKRSVSDNELRYAPLASKLNTPN